jgi:hypothetical protein
MIVLISDIDFLLLQFYDRKIWKNPTPKLMLFLQIINTKSEEELLGKYGWESGVGFNRHKFKIWRWKILWSEPKNQRSSGYQFFNKWEDKKSNKGK